MRTTVQLLALVVLFTCSTSTTVAAPPGSAGGGGGCLMAPEMGPAGLLGLIPLLLCIYYAASRKRRLLP